MTGGRPATLLRETGCGRPSYVRGWGGDGRPVLSRLGWGSLGTCHPAWEGSGVSQCGTPVPWVGGGGTWYHRARPHRRVALGDALGDIRVPGLARTSRPGSYPGPLGRIPSSGRGRRRMGRIALPGACPDNLCEPGPGAARTFSEAGPRVGRHPNGWPRPLPSRSSQSFGTACPPPGVRPGCEDGLVAMAGKVGPGSGDPHPYRPWAPPPPDLSSTVRGSPLRGYTRRGSPRTEGVVDRGGSTAGTRGVGATGAPESTLRGVCVGGLESSGRWI